MINGRIKIDVKIDGCKNNPESWSTTKVGEHISSDFSMSTIFKSIENKHYVNRRKDCMKKFCEFLREHTIGKNDVIKKQTAEIKNEMQTSVIFGKKSFKINMLRIKSIAKKWTIVMIQGNIEFLHVAYVIHKIV